MNVRVNGCLVYILPKSFKIQFIYLLKNIKKSQIDTKRTNLCSSEPYAVPARISVSWSLAGTLKLLNELWLEELPADPHCPAACWHQPQSQWHSHLNQKSVNIQQLLSWKVLANFSDAAGVVNIVTQAPLAWCPRICHWFNYYEELDIVSGFCFAAVLEQTATLLQKLM